jgi:hypothetical protein
VVEPVARVGEVVCGAQGDELHPVLRTGAAEPS